jgi:hypothetical protein
MVTNQSYAATCLEVVKVDRRWQGTCGLYNRELVVIAKGLGLRLVATRRFNPDTAEGVLRVRPNPDSRRSPLAMDGHAVALKGGWIRCPLQYARLPWREYLRLVDAHACTLLEVA